MRPEAARSASGALGLLLRVNSLQSWRRLKAVRQQSRLLSTLIGGFVIGYVLVSFWLFERGLRFVGMFPGLGSLLIERLMFLLFAFLFVLLVFSNIVISYSNLFRNREAAFLLTLPLPPQAIFQWKFLESVVLASWAFVFLVAPLLVAYGWRMAVAWDYYVVTPLLVALFIVLPGVAGAWTTLQLARYLDRRSFQIVALGLSFALLIAAVFWLRTTPVTDEMFETRVLVVLDQLLIKTRFAQFPFLPSYWLSSAVLQWAEGAVAGAVFFVLVLLSYVGLFGLLAFTRTGGLFYEAMSAVHSRGSVLWQWRWFTARQERRRTELAGPGWLERCLAQLRFLTPDVRGLAVKDLRVFWRDTTQWGQTLVLFGLLGAYIVNLRHFSQQYSNPFWVHLVAHLNLGACALNLATLTTRFVFPQLSLEGKRFWIVGMAPLGLRRVVWVKFGLALVASLLITLGLMTMSCQMLQIPAGRTVYFLAAVAVMAFALNGLAVGLGALYPNFREDHPSKIVSGFGGTLCLVLSFAYIVVSVVLLAVGTPWPWTRGGEASLLSALTAWTAFGLASLVTGGLPLRLGLRQMGRFEF